MFLVIGGGIAGLTTALAAERSLPEPVRLLERSPSLEPVGAGIFLWPNALAVLRDLGIDAAAVDAAGQRGVLSGIRARNGRWVRRMDPEVMHRQLGSGAAFHRADLVELVRSRLTRTEITLGAEVESVRADGLVRWRDADTRHELTADVVVAADGLRSQIRTALWPQRPRASGVVCVRAVLDVDTAAAVETWGRGEVAGHLSLGRGRTYLYAARRGPWDGADLSWLASWPEPLPELAAAVARLRADDPSRVHVDELASLPAVRPWTKGRIALVGDAAHGMLPFLGQGACQGIEDAAALVAAIAAGDLPAYERSRRPRAELVARSSASACRTIMADGPAAALRDRLVPLVPTTVSLSQLRRWARTPAPLQVSAG